MMRNWLNNEVLKVLTKTHRHLWESLSTIFPHFWQKAYLSNLATWEEAVKRALTAESACLEQWAEQMATTRGVPEAMSEWMRQVDELMQHLIQTQVKLWEDGLRILMSGTGVVPAAEFNIAAESEGSIEPAEQSNSAEERTESTQVIKLVECGDELQKRDDLKTISGLGPALEKKLNAYGIISYRQIAALSDEEIKRIETAGIKLFGRVCRYNWIKQAKELHFQKHNERL